DADYPGFWRARRRYGRCGRHIFQKRTADTAAALEKIGQARSKVLAVGYPSKSGMLAHRLFGLTTNCCPQRIRAIKRLRLGTSSLWKMEWRCFLTMATLNPDLSAISWLLWPSQTSLLNCCSR